MSKPTKRIGLFGGQFDPVHLGHIHVVNEAINQLELESLIIIPSAHPPHRSQSQTSFNHRFNMLSLAFKLMPQVLISDIEHSTIPNWSIDTVNHFASMYPFHQLHLIIGTDQYIQFHTWKSYEMISNLCTVTIFKRTNTLTTNPHIPRSIHDTFQFINAPIYEISSTQIRHALNIKQTPTLVPEAIHQFITTNHLYQ